MIAQVAVAEVADQREDFNLAKHQDRLVGWLQALCIIYVLFTKLPKLVSGVSLSLVTMFLMFQARGKGSRVTQHKGRTC